MAATDYLSTEEILRNVYDAENSSLKIRNTVEVVPAGTIQMYAGATAPDNWLLCNGAAVSQTTYADLYAVCGTTYNTGSEGAGNFRLPDFRGVFPRGAGTNHKLTNANGTAFAGILGTYQDDKMQGHHHNLGNTTALYLQTAYQVDFTGTSGAPVNTYPAGDGIAVTSATADGTNGTPRTGTETNPANLTISFIIKY